MSKNRVFGSKPKQRLIVSVELATIKAIDGQINYKTSWGYVHGNRSEFVRRAIEEKLQREASKNGC